MKKIILIVLFLCVSLLVPLGCTNGGSTSPTLSVYNWSTYIDPAVVKEFEQKFGVKVQYDTYENTEQLYAKLKPGNPGYDVVFPTDYMIPVMAKEGLLAELDHSQIPNIKNLDPKFTDKPFDRGNKYSLPYQWGTLGIGYNMVKSGEAINSWEEVFSSRFKGKVALVDEYRTMLGAILIFLDYDPNTTKVEEIDAAKKFLIQHKDSIAAFAADNGQLLLDQGEVEIAVEWSGDIFQVMEENADLGYAIPKEGTVIWIDNMAIAKNAPHPELAAQFINFILEPKISAQISNFVQFGSPNLAAKQQGLINEELTKNPAIYPPEEVFAKLTYLQDVGPQANRLYDQAWTEIKAAVGS